MGIKGLFNTPLFNRYLFNTAVVVVGIVGLFHPTLFNTPLFNTGEDHHEEHHQKHLSGPGSHRHHVIINVPIRGKSHGSASSSASLEAQQNFSAHSAGSSSATAKAMLDISPRIASENEAIMAWFLSA